MELNESSNSDCAKTASNSSVRKPSVEECNSANNSNGDSGYHSDLSGYHKGSDFLKTIDKSYNSDPLAAMPSRKFGDEYCEAVSTSPTCTNSSHYTVSENSISNPLQSTNCKIECDRLLSESGHNVNHEFKISPKHFSDHSNGIKTTLQTIGAGSSLPLSCSSVYSSPGSLKVQSSTSIISVGPLVSCNHNHLPKSETVFTPPKQGELTPSRKNEEWTAVIHDLALKIEFCVMFGFTPGQIKTAITKLSYKASKNDILAELSSVQQTPVLPPTTINIINSFEDYDSLSQPVGEAISHGVDISQDSDAQSRGPLIVDNESKTGNGGGSSVDDSENLRPIVIDGSNVAMSHGNKQYFSCKGILLAVDYFRNRNHRDITVFVPNYRKELPRSDALVKDREILDKLEEERILVYTPSRHIKGKRVTCYDDRFILRLAQETEGVIVSNDNFRDLQNEKPEWKELVEKRLLMYSFASDRFMPPDDPLGRNGPNIDNFLRKRPASEEQNKPQCPYGKKCTFGKKCKYFHPECARPVSERMKEKSEKRLKASTESIELAIELTRSFRSPTTENIYSRNNVYPKDSQIQEGVGQIQENKLNPPNSWKLDNERQRRMPTSVAHDNLMYNRNHGGNHRIFSGSIPTEHGYTSAPGYPNQSVRSDHFRLMGSQNHYPGPQNLPVSSAQVCFETRCQKYQIESTRVNYPSKPYVPVESGPPDFHLENKPSFSNPQASQPYQRSSPANLQMFDRANSGNGALLHRQHMNLVPPYSVAYQISPNPVYPSGYTDSHFQHNQHLLHSYPVPHSGSSNPGLPHNMINPSPYFVAPINSTGSNGSLSHSYPFVAPEKSIVSPPMSQRSMTNSSTGSDSKTYPPRAPRGYSTAQVPEQHVRQGPFMNSTYGGNDPAARHQARMHAAEPPLNNVNNPRHYLYKNLCSLFQRHIVEAVMTRHPEICDPKKIVKMCLESN